MGFSRDSLNPKLRRFYDVVLEAFARDPIIVDAHPYDIGYWATRKKLPVPLRVCSGEMRKQFEAGVAQALKDTDCNQ